MLYMNCSMITKIPFTVVDVETTGGRAGADRVIEVAAVKICGGEIIDSFSTLINPGRGIPPMITWLTGITDKMTAGAPVFGEITGKFKKFLGDTVFAAHNVEFDYRFIDMECVLADSGALTNSTVCTLRLARRVFPGLLYYNLSDLCSTLRVPLKRAHRALDDATATAKILIRMLNKLDACGLGAHERFRYFYALPPRECADLLKA